jgi:hypothetical protein
MNANTVEDFKLVVCDVRDGSLISQHPPRISGVDWLEIPGTRREAGRYYQAVFAGRVPESECEDLPGHCSVVNRFVHVTRLNVTYQEGMEVLEVCHQEFEGDRINAENYQ